MGKRVQARVLPGGRRSSTGIEGCNYLLALDMEMDPCPATRWRAGSRATATSTCGRTSRRCGESRGSRGPRSSSATSRGTTARRSSPRRARSCSARSSARPRPASTPMFGSELEFFLLKETLRGGAREALPRPDAVGAVHPRLPRPRVDLRRAADPRRSATDGGAPVSGRELQGRGLAGPAGDQLPLRGRADDGRQPRHLQERRQGDRAPERLLDHLHGEARPRVDRQLVPPPLEPLARRRERLRRRVGHLQAVPRRARSRARGARDLPRADDQLVQALRRRRAGRRRRSPGATTTGPAASASSGTATRCAPRRGSRAPTSTRTSRSRR